MAYITLMAPWTHRTPLRTTRYPEGRHRVTANVAEDAIADGVTEEEDDGDSSADAGAPGGSGPAEE